MKKSGKGYTINKVNEELIEIVFSGVVEMETAKLLEKDSKELFNGKPMNVLVDTKDVIKIRMDALNYFSNHSSELTNSGAFVVGNSLIANNLAHMFIDMTDNNDALRLFKDKNQALSWLNTNSAN